MPGDKFAAHAGAPDVMNGLALPAVLLLAAAIFAGAVAVDYRREHAWRTRVDTE